MARSLTPAQQLEKEQEDTYNASFILRRYQEGLLSIQNRISDYWLNHAFMLGFQWTFVEERTGLVREVPQEPEREQVVINRIWPNTRIIIAKLTQRELTFINLPSAADDGSIRAARIGESIIRATSEDHDWEAIREKAAWMAWKGGTAAIAVEWDSSAGHVTVGPTETSGEIRGGDTVETVLGVADFVVEPGVRDAETARYWIKVEALPPQVVQSIYNLEDEPESDVTAGSSGIMKKLISTSGVGNATSAGGTGDNLALVLTYYERPNAYSPNGRCSVVVDGAIVEGEDPDKGIEMAWPFPFKDRLNFALIRETVVESEWTGQTVLSMARGVQATYNAAWSSIIEHMKLAGNARLAVPESSMDLMDEFTDLPGEIVPFDDSSNPPFYLQPAQLPAWLIDTPVNLAMQMDDIMGVHDISRGSSPANVESGYGLSILAEQDSTPVGRMSKEIAKAFSKVARMVLELMEDNVTSSRESIVTENGQPPHTTEWSGKDLLGQTRARVPLESIVPRNRAAQLQLAKDLQAGGLVQTLDQFMAIAELADADQILEKVDPDTARARRENHSFRSGRGAHPAEYDDHEVHVREHNIFRKSQAYEMMPEGEREVVDLHIERHADMAAGEAGAMAGRMDVGGPSLAAAPTASETPLPPGMEEMLAGGGAGPGLEGFPEVGGEPSIEGATMQGVAPPLV